MITDATRAAILRTLTWFETIGYPPTQSELFASIDVGASSVSSEDVEAAFCGLVQENGIVESTGRVAFPETAERVIETVRSRDALQPRKRRRARRVASWLARFAGVRFVALANTTALGYARDEGDLDFFVIVRAGSIWTVRLFGGLPFRLLGMTPRPNNERDAVCLSYFIADDALDLASHELDGDDPYFRYWFLSLLPLYDDGASKELWEANTSVRARHPFARPWIVSPDLRIVPGCRLPTAVSRFFEPLSRWLQMRWFPAQIRERMNRDSTVIVDDHALKFHVTDGREEYRRKYRETCERRGIEL